MIRVCISGIGKTGKEIAKFLLEQKDIKLVSAICSPNSNKKGKDLGEIIGKGNTGVKIESSDKIEQIVFRTKPDVVVDFSSPEAAARNAKVFSKLKVNIVIGTTGFSDFTLKRLFLLANKHRNGIVYAPNITLGVNVLMLLTNLAANLLSSYDFQITEVHHKNKKDSPSGTAKKIADEIEKGIKHSGNDDTEVQVPITAIRAGGVVGKHDVMIIGEDDKIEISHESFSRKAFALGTLRAVKFIKGKVGYYEMNDVLNLKKVLNDYIQEENKSNKKRYKNLLGKNEIKAL
ncbi:MAG: 4-hydroxy-tetrahydrodipicolinate reductase [Clostridiaceae bacterium]|nr:4-hydroxy-tetrahydrodipicolinate reductase [Clostridiaceae bacterium]